MVMRRVIGLVGITLFFLLVASGVVLWLSLPRVVEVSPADGAVDAPGNVELRIRFSRPMQPQSVLDHLTIQPPAPGKFVWESNQLLVFTPEQPWLPGATIQVALRPGAQAQDFPALRLNELRSWSFTIRQPRLAFLYPSDGAANIYVRETTGGENRFLTNMITGVLDFTVDPSGEFIYFSLRNPRGGSDLYQLDISEQFRPLPQAETAAAPPPPEMIVECSPAQCRAPTVAPGGDYLAYERTLLTAQGEAIKPQVWLLPLSQPAAARQVGDPEHTALQPTWSPQGWLTFYDSDAAAFIVVDAQGNEQMRFTNQTGQPGDWQPEGQAFVAPEIFFLDANVSPSLGLERLADSHLLMYNLPGGEPRDLTREEGVEDVAPAFSPDGTRLAFARKFLDTRRWTPGRQLWLMDLAQQRAQPLTEEDIYNHFDFAWSPAGDRLAFVRFNQSLLTEPPEIWVLDLASGEQTQIIVGGYAPQWIP